MVRFLKDTVPVNIYKKAKNITCPTQIVHGDADKTVPLKQSEDLFQSIGSENKKLTVISGALHIMRGKYMEKAHSEIANFLEKTLL